MLNPWIIGGALAGATLLGYGLMRKAKASTIAKADPVALKKGYDAGCADGDADVAVDTGKVHNPRPLLNFSEVAEVQQQYENGYNDCYEKKWIAPATSPDVVHDSAPSEGGIKKGMTAYQYGCSRGGSAGLAAYQNGEDGNSWAAKLETAGSKKRQAESGNAADYRKGYKECFIGKFTGAAAADAFKDVSPFGTSGLNRTSGLTAVGRLNQRAPSWQGGVRIGATSRAGGSYKGDSEVQTGGT